MWTEEHSGFSVSSVKAQIRVMAYTTKNKKFFSLDNCMSFLFFGGVRRWGGCDKCRLVESTLIKFYEALKLGINASASHAKADVITQRAPYCLWLNLNRISFDECLIRADSHHHQESKVCALEEGPGAFYDSSSAAAYMMTNEIKSRIMMKAMIAERKLTKFNFKQIRAWEAKKRKTSGIFFAFLFTFLISFTRGENETVWSVLCVRRKV